jgi:DNA-binding transcriptional ArsR family regulator
MQTPRKFISRFSPNRTDPEVLEQIDVQRQDLLSRSIAALRESALTQNKHHLLFVGPRGSGKTHLLALIFHRLQGQSDLAKRLRVAWLNEDETSTSFFDLLLRIYRALAASYPAEFPSEVIEKLSGRDLVEALDVLGKTLISKIGKRTVLVLIENLDTLFIQLDESEQRAWRAFIQNNSAFATAATAQRLFAGVAQRDQPFFGFFDTTHLQPFTAAEAVELLRRVAQLNQNAPLMAFLGTPQGKARVQAIHHLSGGNPRLYVVLSDFITSDSLDELVGPFEEMVDEQLTPYYQERLRWLSPQQRKIVELLCSRARPVAVKEISAALFAEAGSIGSPLQKLREMGYVRPNPRGRESLYELAEPLMRLSMEVKNTRNPEPLRLIVDFLRVWFDPHELESLSTRCDTEGLGFKYLTAALKPGQPDLRRDLLLQETEREAKADVVRAIGLPGAPDEAVSLGRAWMTSWLFETGDWEPGMKYLTQFLAGQEKSARINARVSGALVQAVFGQIGLPDVWQARVGQALALCRAHGVLVYLGGALIQHLALLKKSPLSPAGLDQWLAGWEAHASSEPAFRLPLRLLRAGIAYLKTQPHDEGVLLQLPMEERQIVRSALGLADERTE